MNDLALNKDFITNKFKLLEKAKQYHALSFGDFILKSGRRSPYFFNLGNLSDGESIHILCNLIAITIKDKIDNGMQIDVLFGPAYKGITLVAVTAQILFQKYKINIPFAFNRKELKNHGEGGKIIGTQIQGNVLILDDVITAGTAISDSFTIIKNFGAKPISCCVVLDRQEKAVGEKSAIEYVKDKFEIDVFSILDFATISFWLQKTISSNDKNFQNMIAYRELYGVSESFKNFEQLQKTYQTIDLVAV